MKKSATRADYILDTLLRTGEVSVDALCTALEVDSSTIRRDLEKLERQGRLRRIHGGAVAVDTLAYDAYPKDLSFQDNMQTRLEEKARIARAALALIQPGATVALSPGTTTTVLARAIRQSQIANLTVVTNALNIATELAGLRNLTLVLTGGTALPDFFALVGPLAEHSLNELYMDVAFVGIHGISAEHGLSGPHQLEALTHRATMRRARQAVVLADHSKIGRVAMYRIAPLTAMHTLITDAAAPAAELSAIAAQGVEVRTV